MKKQYGFYLDANSCTGCGTCVVACQDKNNTPLGLAWRRVSETEDGGYRAQGKGLVTDVYAFYVSTSCHHCQSPPCVDVCPAGAISKREDDGLVVLEAESCTGCELCISACPYEAICFHEEKAQKCDGCLDLHLDAELPLCVSSCPMRVLDFALLEELQSKYPDAVPLDTIYGGTGKTSPSMIIKPHRHGQTNK